MQALDCLLPEDTTYVVFDTSPARDLIYSCDSPAWVNTFAEMNQAGYSFLLADHAFAELHSQIVRGSISGQDASNLLQKLEVFLNLDFPIFPGKADIYALIGSKDKASDWTTTQLLELSTKAWAYLKSARAGEDSLSLSEELQDECKNWIELLGISGERECPEVPLNEYQHPQLDLALKGRDVSSAEVSPPLSVRWDLKMRFLWRQYVRSKKDFEPYNPKSPKKRNDGIDFELFDYLMLPAFVVASEKGFHTGLSDIQSYQKEWIWKPDELARAWVEGKEPRPRWPA